MKVCWSKSVFTGIEWTIYGKISQITKTNSGVTTVIKYTYDATGNRIGKWVQVGAGTPKQTAYVRDASGNVMAIYEKGNSEVNGGLLSQIEVPLYGSSRLGVWRPDREVETTGWELFDTDPMTGTGGGIAGGWERGRVQFELSNHLGNVLVTISDVRIPVLMPEGIELCDDPVHPACYRPIDYYLPQVLTANDYYPFGMGMPGRKYSEGNYRYGFNGKENDNDVKGEGNQQDYGMRIYDPRLGRFLSVDPLEDDYPWNSPYSFAEGDPINYIDLDGAEKSKSELQQIEKQNSPRLQIIKENASLNLITLKGAADAVLNANLLNAPDLWNSLWGNSPLDDYSTDEEKEAYLRGRIAGDIVAALQGLYQISAGGSTALATSGGTLGIGAVVGGGVAAHGAAKGAVAANDIGWAIRELYKLNVQGTAGSDVTTSTNQQTQSAHQKVMKLQVITRQVQTRSERLF